MAELLGPYNIDAEGVIYEKRGIKILPTVDRLWVIKLISPDKESLDNIDEIKHILRLLNDTPRCCVEFPRTSPYYLFGTTPDAVWYAMVRYNGHVSVDSLFCKSNWRRIAVSVLMFLEDLHITHHLAHLDIKAENILYNREKQQFYIGDFEMLAEVETTPVTTLRDKMSADSYYFWYYLGYGGELDKPVQAWRIDFVMLGYLLARLTWNTEYSWSARNRIVTNAQSRQGLIEDETLLGLIEQRDSQLRAGACPSVVAYMDRVAAAVPWDLKVPPERALYRELRALFQ